ncbi:MAG: hypothetical protein ACP6IP_06930 [Candidatus Njordarchaeia archaeon]
MVHTRISFVNLVGKTMIVEGFLFLILSFIFYRIRSGEVHGYILATYALVQFVTGVYFHIITTYHKKAPPKTFVLLPSLIPIMSFAFYLYQGFYISNFLNLLNFTIILTILAYCFWPIKGKFWFQMALGFSSYFSMFIVFLISVSYVSLVELYLGYLSLFGVAVGLIITVNSVSIPFTYGLKPRSSLTFALSILIASMPFFILAGVSITVYLILLIWLLYILFVRFDAIQKWFSKIDRFKGQSRIIHLNLILGHVVSIVTLPITVLLFTFGIVNFVDFIHILAFGFVLPEIVAHGPVMFPILLKRPPRKTKLILTLSPLSAILYVMRTMRPFNEIVSEISGGLVVLLLIFMLLVSIRLKK